MADLLSLAERCEKAAGPDRELDADISCSEAYPFYRPENTSYPAPSGGGRVVTHYASSGTHGTWISSRYTASLDAAMTLAPKGRAALVLQQGMDACLTATHHRADDFTKLLSAFVTAASLRAIHHRRENGE